MSDTRIERTEIKNPEEFEMHIEFLQPWSTFVMKTKLPPPILEKMIKISDKIIEDKDPAIRFGHSLAGQIEDEFFIEPNILKREGVISFFLEMCQHFIITAYIQRGEQEEKMRPKTDWSPILTSAWVVSQKDNEYNPTHNHKGVVSGVMYLKIPEYLPDRKSPEKRSKVSHDGAILFSNNTSQCGIWAIPEFLQQPQVGDIFLFPSTQRHQVFPFRTPDGKGERRSVSFNADLDKPSAEYTKHPHDDS